MRAAELLKKVPNLTERQLQYLAGRGYIPYKPMPEGEVTRREYDEKDLPYITYLVSLINQNISPKKACLMAKEKFLPSQR